MLTDEAKLFLSLVCLAAIIVPCFLTCIDHTWQVNQVLKPLRDHLDEVADLCDGPDTPGSCIDEIIVCRNRILHAAGAIILGRWWVVWGGYRWAEVTCAPVLCLDPFRRVDVTALAAIRDEFLEHHRCLLAPDVLPPAAPTSGPLPGDGGSAVPSPAGSGLPDTGSVIVTVTPAVSAP